MKYFDEGKYIADITQKKPTLIFFLINFSTSNKKLSDSLNVFINYLIISSSRSDGTRNYFDIGVIGYGHKGAYNGFQGSLNSSIINSIANIESSPLRVEDRKKKVDDGNGGFLEITTKYPVWFDENYNLQSEIDDSKNLNLGLINSAKLMVEWCDQNPNSYPPTFVHIGFNSSINSESERIFNLIKQINTNDGEVIIFNVDINGHYSFPKDEENLGFLSSKNLFKLASDMPLHYFLHLKNMSFNSEKNFEFSVIKKMKCFLSLEDIKIISFLLSTLIGSEGGMYRTFFNE